ncbi:TlpA disulfide reductase family protein [Facklamia sp. 7083-14-GEN3]|uniref:TlpA family protein disulfide reductase n=1 Tax=Facklamia sp. 7083-14-GEN3 TaxID=2973478 RepID=UPI00215BD063|nr:TlpA disulfide reductase family protein [Facklamia sp. 7083-14-GEN3]MCR8968572.1 TlpA family protein disulfide reductase [Facklamia sp. 7083-14-GEN3]
MKKLLTYGLLLIAIIGFGSYIYNKVQDQNLSIEQTEPIQETVSEIDSTTSQPSEKVSEEKEISFQSSREESSQSNSTKEEKPDPYGHLKVESVLIKDQADKSMTLSENFGRPMVVNVWATWCPPCKKEMPYFQTAWEDYQEDIDFYMINATNSQPGETKEAVNEFLEDLNLTLPVFYDVNFSAMMSLQATFLPSTIFINEEGEVVYHHIGLISEKQLLEQIEELL